MTSDAEVMLAEDIGSFYADPLGFVMYSFPWDTNENIQQVEMPEKYQKKYGVKYGPDAWAIQFLEDIATEVVARKFDGRHAVLPIQFSTASGHGIGKSTLTAWIILWIMSTRPFAKGIVTANTSDQLRTKTWSELGKWWKLSITQHWFQYNSGRGSMSLAHRENIEQWRCDAQTCREENSEAFAGLHAANSTPFYIFDEAGGVPDKIFDVREGGTTDGEPMTFDFGNPTRNTGRFFENCIGQFSHRYHVRSIDSREVSITNKIRIDQWIEDYGEDSDFVKVRVRGVFPSVGIFQFIPTDAVMKAMDRPFIDDKSAPLVLGVDVARFGDDSSVIYPRMGRDASSFEPVVLKGKDTVQVAGSVIEQVRMFRNLGKTVRAIFVDCGGVGGGVFDQLKALGYSPVEVYAQHRPTDVDSYRWKTDEMWGRMKESIIGGLSLPNKRTDIGQELFSELTQRDYDFTIKGQINLESKSDMKDRDIASPNIADALALTYYAEVGMEEEAGDYLAPRNAQADYNPLEAKW